MKFNDFIFKFFCFLAKLKQNKTRFFVKETHKIKISNEIQKSVIKFSALNIKLF